MLKYLVNEDKLPMYGIDAVENGRVVAKAEAIFDNRREAEKFAGLCNRVKLSHLHLLYVAQDIIADNTGE